MHYIEYDGIEYRSWRDACRCLGINYSNFRRFCRHYVRADKDPAVAVRWCLGLEKRKVREPKTWKFEQDQEQAQEYKFNRIAEQSEKLNSLLR